MNFIFPDLEAFVEDNGSLGLSELENRLKEPILRQAIEVLKERPDLKKYLDELKRRIM